MNELIQSLLDIPEETQTIEFKLLGEDKKVVTKTIETIVAMANTDGGRVVVGIDDPEKSRKKGINRINGIDTNKELFDEILRELQRIVPPISEVAKPQLVFVEECNKTVAVLRIPKATNCFHSINNHVYVRLNKGNKRLSPQEVIKLSYAKGFEKADKELVKVDFDLLDTKWYQEWKENRKIAGRRIQDVLFKTGLARKNRSGTLLPTRAAVLLFAEYPTNLMDTKCTIRVLQYTGRIENYREAPNLVANPVTIEGPMIELIARAHEFVLTLLRAGIEIHSGFVTKYRIPERAIKEAITNAVIHRDYHIKRDVEVKIFEDRVEINSPGLFPYNITKTNIGKVRADGYRNDLLVKHLREFPEPPNLDQNEGVKAIQSEMYTHNLYPPAYWTYPMYDDAVEVGLFNEHRPGEWEKIKDFLVANKYVNNTQGRQVTGIVQAYKMSTLFSKWVDQGLIVKIQPRPGAKRNTKYKLASQEEIEETR